jgi:hypothetical protein
MGIGESRRSTSENRVGSPYSGETPGPDSRPRHPPILALFGDPATPSRCSLTPPPAPWVQCTGFYKARGPSAYQAQIDIIYEQRRLPLWPRDYELEGVILRHKLAALGND